jgi:hypothetical protein
MPEEAAPNDAEDGDNLPKEVVRDLGAEMDQAYAPQTTAYGLRECRVCNYDHLYPNAVFSQYSMKANYDHLYPDAVFSQYSMKAGLKLFEDRGTQAVLKELWQLHNRVVMEPVHASEMSREDQYQMLNYIMMVKENRHHESRVTYLSHQSAGAPGHCNGRRPWSLYAG